MRRIIAAMLVALILLSSVGALADYGALVKQTTQIYADSKLKVPLGSIPRHTAVVVKSVKSGKAYILYRGFPAYVRNSSLHKPWDTLVKQRRKQDELLDDCSRYVKKSCYVYDYPSTSARKLTRVKKGTILTGFKEFGGWSIVMDLTDTYYGYVKTSYLEGYGSGDGSHYPLN